MFFWTMKFIKLILPAINTLCLLNTFEVSLQVNLCTQANVSILDFFLLPSIGIGIGPKKQELLRL